MHTEGRRIRRGNGGAGGSNTSLTMDVMMMWWWDTEKGEGKAGGDREKEGRGQYEGSPHVAAERKSKKVLHRTAQPLKSESIQFSKKQHLTATPVSAFKPSNPSTIPQ